VAPDSTGGTWDIAVAGFAGEAVFIDRVLRDVFSRVVVDATRIAAIEADTTYVNVHSTKYPGGEIRSQLDGDGHDDHDDHDDDHDDD